MAVPLDGPGSREAYALDAIVPKLRGVPTDPGFVVDGPRAAVAAILRELPRGAVELFFILRAEHPHDPWSGHVAFPGGRRDPEDESLLRTAIRETREEVGIELAAEHLVGRLPDVSAFTRSKKGNLVVTPFVFALRSEVAVVPNDEVATTLWVPLTTLADRAGKSTFKLEYNHQTLDLPYIHLDPGQHRLWGLTYRMLETLLDAIR